MDISVGHDLEFFLIQQGRFIPSQGVIPGTKDEPEKLSTCTVHRDNVAGEFGTPPQTEEDAFVESVYAGIEEIQSHLSPLGVLMKFIPTCVFTQEDLMHPEAETFGCLPDYNIWTNKENPQPSPSKDKRWAGGHVHIGFDLTQYRRLDIARSADIALGLYSAIHDSDTERRLAYGAAGAYREKPYGIESRVCSNFWANEERHIRNIFRSAVAAVEFCEEILDLCDSDAAFAVQHAVNTCDAVLAQEMIDWFELEEIVRYAN